MEEQINRLEFKNTVDHYRKEPHLDWRLPPDEKLGFSGIFPIPIATFYYPYNDQILNAVKCIISDVEAFAPEKCRESGIPVVKSNFGVGDKLKHYYNTSPQDLFKENHSFFHGLQRWIEHRSLYFINEVMGYYADDVIITSSWINVANEGASQYLHCHSNSFVSGVYYVNFEEDHAPLQFINPRDPDISTTSILTQKPRKATPYNMRSASVPIKGGDVVLFPSWLNHEYVDNKRDGRISIAFNVVPNPIDNGAYQLRIDND